MSTPLRALLAEFRNSAKTEREKGNYFERLAADFIKNDHGMAQEYEDAWLYSEWAQLHGSDGRDTGIDVVAKSVVKILSAPFNANSIAKATAFRRPTSTASSRHLANVSSHAG